MRPFSFHRASSVDDAVRIAAATGGRYLAGGTNMLDLMKDGVETPDDLIDINRIGLTAVTETESGSVLVDAGVTNSAVANHPLIRSRYPVLSHAILSGATTQLRNMATVGGNLVQRTRCPYFMDRAFESCNKRVPGSGCAAREGFNREHAVLGASSECVAVHPSDMAVALTALDAVVHVVGPDGGRRSAIGDFYRLPGGRPDLDHTLREHELITGIELPASPFARSSRYLKIRDRHSYAFALISVAAGLDVVDGEVRAAAIALGGVSAVPWRVPEAERSLVGRPPTEENFSRAARIAMAGAHPLSQNAFKVDLGRHGVVRALTEAARAR